MQLVGFKNHFSNEVFCAKCCNQGGLIHDTDVTHRPLFCDNCNHWIKTELSPEGLRIVKRMIDCAPGNAASSMESIIYADNFSDRDMFLKDLKSYIHRNIIMGNNYGINTDSLVAIRTVLSI